MDQVLPELQQVAEPVRQAVEPHTLDILDVLLRQLLGTQPSIGMIVIGLFGLHLLRKKKKEKSDS